MAVVSLGCPTVKTCVKECPKITTNFDAEGKKRIIKDFCVSHLSVQQINSTPFQSLIKDEECPSHILESQPTLGRCIPRPQPENPNPNVISKSDLEKGKSSKVISLDRILFWTEIIVGFLLSFCSAKTFYL